ncbi:piggyBac transposable element-derived protein 4-like [Odontomachus brunneus]|uniref:piggyBac transposable element-derived protein 4-like n=1 Tax=Odontomachus brunneus TaxID=486640 RepID=UPI0013F2A11F|nr:piggyBac transposable element-derived protein 4-like [Odontomachus brunneus]
MNENNTWSSGESEPEEQDLENENTDIIISENDYDGSEFFEDADFYPSIKNFNGNSRINPNISLPENKPIDYFNHFCDPILLQMIVDESNRYESQSDSIQSSHMKSWTPLTKDELDKFLGLSILMGHVRKGELKNYWSTDLLLHTPIFPQIMSRDRYLQILRNLHFHNNEEITNHPLEKIKPIIDHLQNKFSGTLIPGKNLCIDESLLLWKGRLRFKQYIPLKRNRFGIKLFMIVDCETGFILGFIVYTGADTDYEKFGLGITGDIVAHFLQPYFYKGHVIYIDNWYTSPMLADFLHDHDTGICGTVKANRKGMPNLDKKLGRGEVQVAHSHTWMAMKWEDKRSVRMLTSVHEFEFRATGKKHYKTKEDIIKPTCVQDYNQNMGGIDNIDRQLSITESVRKTMKWYRKLFLHLIDLCLTNAHALYKMENEEPMSFPSFRLQILLSTLESRSWDWGWNQKD